MTTPLIVPGERAAFAALSWVKTVHRDAERGNAAHSGISQSQCVRAAIGLMVLSEIIERRYHQGLALDTDDVLNQLVQLPVFFSVHWVHEWENKRPWASMDGVHPSVAMEYGSIFENERALAYQGYVGAARAVWKLWLAKAPADEVAQVLVQSANRIWSWSATRKYKDLCIANMATLATMLSGRDTAKRSKALAYAFMLENDVLSNALHDLYLCEKGTSVWTLMACWSQALALKSDAFTQLFEGQSVYVQARLLACPQWDRQEGWASAWRSARVPELFRLASERAPVKNALSIFGKPWSHEQAPLIPESAASVWDYVEGIAGVQHAMQKGVAQRVLVYGKPGIGKSHLIGSLLARSGYVGFEPNTTKHGQASALDKGTGSSSGSGTSRPFYSWNCLRRLSANTSNVAFVVDGAERYIDFSTADIEDVLPQHAGAFELWSVSDLTKIPAMYLGRFDAVLAIEAFPIAARIALSKTLFSDANVATRVAQAVKTPLDMCKVAQWCRQTGDASWENTAQALSFHAKARYLNESGVFEPMQPVQLLGPLPAIAGYPALQEVMDDIVHLFNKPDDYIRLGAKPPKGVLLVGPPGTGKTHFARHLSRTVNIPLFAPDSSDLAQHPQRIGHVFSQARRHAPCILFFDEIDVLINTPEKSQSTGPDLAQQKITNTFLAELDGLESNEGILVVGATHRKDYLDPAAIRRLHDVVHLELPNLQGRESIWKSHLHERALASDVCAATLARVTDSFTGADIAQALNLGARIAAQSSQTSIGMPHLLQACDTVHWGHPDGVQCVAAEDRRRVAIHEAGHALVAWRNKMGVQRITIRPRARFLGSVHATVKEGEVILGREGVKNRLAMLLGGICAEEAVYGAYASGGSGDLAQAKKLVQRALHRSGLGQHGPMAENEIKDMSEQRKTALEQEESQWMQEQFSSTLAWLTARKDLLLELSELLLEKIELSGQGLDAFSYRVVG